MQKSADTSQTKVQIETGSRINRAVNMSGCITDGASQLIIINEEAIRRSGAVSLSGVLNRYGAGR